MAFKSYLIRYFDNTNENSFFRVFSNQLRKAYKNDDALHILIGNVSCGGHQIDALFVANGKIIVIDFKNYGGKLTFSENNPWRIATDGDFVFVKGGGKIRNPYQQVNAYRHTLIQFLSSKQTLILEPNHFNFNWGHISGMVLFHKPITYNEDEVPHNIKLYFDVADNNNCIDKISDRNSPQLTLNDNEIKNLLSIIDVKEENLYDEEKESEYPQIPTIIQDAVERLELVRNILSKVTAKSELEKLLVYYQTLINIERQKEPIISEEHFYHIDWSNVADVIKINLEDNPQFHVRYQKNSEQNFPKNLFIGINFLFNSQTIPLLYNVIAHKDILSHTNIEFPIEDFSLYAKPLEDRNYPDELIEELTTAINLKSTITEKIEILGQYLGYDIELIGNLTLAFSEENPFTAQLLSELKAIVKKNLVLPSSFMEKFLTKKAITDNIKPIESSEFIQITPLNKSQKEAIQYSFNQPITVITGPPGTGKTQVVLNILANAIVFNKKVLLASKNNQAVDHVKERLAALIQEKNYLLRFGSKTEIKDKTKPIIESFIRRIHDNSFEDNTDRLLNIQKKIKECKAKISNSEEKIEIGRRLEGKIFELQKELEEKEFQFQNFLNLEENKISIFKKLTKDNLIHIISECNIAKYEIIYEYKGLKKYFFDLFKKKKYAIKLMGAFDSWPSDLKKLAELQNIYINLENLKNGESIINSYQILIKFIESGVDLLDKKNAFEEEIVRLQSEISKKEAEFKIFKLEENTLQDTINKCQKRIEDIGIPLLNELIHKKIRECDASELNKFKNYIPDNNPSNSEELQKFVETTKHFLDYFNINAITSLSIKNAFPLTEKLFDLVVIDEASQCDIASALPLIFRTKQLVVIGDPMQLKHVTKVKSYEEKYIINTLEIDKNLHLDYVNESLYDYCYNISIESKTQSVFLKEHFRCHPQIIEYSNRAFYRPLMGQELEILTDPKNYNVEPKGIFWIDTVGEHDKYRNANIVEQKKAIDLACKLADIHKNITIGITTPFAHQANDINEAIPKSLREIIKVSTVHRFQGDEKDIIILSLVISYNSPKHKAEWINYKVPYLINVAVTRAKNTLYIVGNADYCRKLPLDSPLGHLVNYIDTLQNIQKLKN